MEFERLREKLKGLTGELASVLEPFQDLTNAIIETWFVTSFLITHYYLLLKRNAFSIEEAERSLLIEMLFPFLCGYGDIIIVPANLILDLQDRSHDFLRLAIYKENEEWMEIALQYVDEAADLKRELLLQTIQENKLKLIKRLVNLETDLNATDGHASALIYAIWSHDLEVVKLLVEGGADLNLAVGCYEPLEEAYLQDWHLFLYLVGQKNAEFRKQLPHICLMQYAARGEHAFFATLMKEVRFLPEVLHRVLLCAVYFGHVQIVQTLFEHWKASDEHLVEAIKLARERSHEAVMDYLTICCLKAEIQAIISSDSRVSRHRCSFFCCAKPKFMQLQAALNRAVEAGISKADRFLTYHQGPFPSILDICPEFSETQHAFSASN